MGPVPECGHADADTGGHAWVTKMVARGPTGHEDWIARDAYGAIWLGYKNARSSPTCAARSFVAGVTAGNAGVAAGFAF